MAKKRKIPVRKHHGVRDPLKQRVTKEKQLAKVTNNPPERGRDQQTYSKFAQFKKLVDDTKAGKKLKRLTKSREDRPRIATTARTPHEPKTKDTTEKFKRIRQFPGETDRDYLRRVNRITSESLREAQYEIKYGVSVVRNSSTGAITVNKRPKNEIDQLLEKKKKERQNRKLRRKGKRLKEAPVLDANTIKDLVKRVIREDDAERKQDTESEFKRDIFKFGEVVHAPPMLSTLPRKAEKCESAPRPGKKNNLLLRSMLIATTVNNPKSSADHIQMDAHSSGAMMKGKRKDLPAGTRLMLEKERNKIVEHYRELKKTKQNQPS